MRIRLWFLLVFIACAMTIQAADTNTPKYLPPTIQEVLAVQKQGRYLATITLMDGQQIDLVLEGSYMPFTVANFIKLVKAKFYDGLTFHSIVPNYTVQGGDPKGNGTGGPGYTIKLEINLFLSHKPGTISMARGDDLNSAGSQFYITEPTIAKDASDFLDGRSAVFGWVKTGMESVKKIQQDDTMKSVTVTPYAGQEECPILIDSVKATHK